MQRLVVDTDLLIDWLRMRQGRWLELVELMAQGKADIYCSSVTVVELFAGKSAKLQEKFIEEIISKLQVVSLDGQLARQVGMMKQELGNSVALADLIVGVTTLWCKAKLVTRNKKHFRDIPGLKFFSV